MVLDTEKIVQMKSRCESRRRKIEARPGVRIAYKGDGITCVTIRGGRGVALSARRP